MALDTDSLLVADSFRVRVDPDTDVAEVRGFALHLDRFRDSVAEVLEGMPNDDWWDLQFEPFLDSVPEQINAAGEGFPRVELWADEQTDARKLRFRARPLPKLGTKISLQSAPNVHSRLVAPYIKGPNLSRLVELNSTLGAEALLTDADGSVVEGATTSLLWWRGDTLHAATSQNRVGSVTEVLVQSIAEHLGYAPELAEEPPAALVSCEVWAVNALHGIRCVTAIDGLPLKPPQARRLAAFRDALDSTWQPVA